MTEYVASTFKTDSQFLFAVGESQTRFGAANSSLVIALLITVAAVGAVGISFRGHAALPLGLAGAVALLATIVATHVDIRTTKAVRSQLPADLRWVDHAAAGQVSAIETPLAQKQDLLYQLYWNTSIRRELLLGTADATDAFDAPRLRIENNGTLRGVTGDILFHDYGALGRLANGRQVATNDQFTLWRSAGRARFLLVIEGRYWDGWLGALGRLRAWPRRSDEGVSASFELSLPRDSRSSLVKIGRANFKIRPGDSTQVTCRSGRGPLDLTLSGSTTLITRDFRRVSARLTKAVVADHPGAPTKPTCSASKPRR
jgi:hypothetical protein